MNAFSGGVEFIDRGLRLIDDVIGRNYDAVGGDAHSIADGQATVAVEYAVRIDRAIVANALFSATEEVDHCLVK